MNNDNCAQFLSSASVSCRVMAKAESVLVIKPKVFLIVWYKALSHIVS